MVWQRKPASKLWQLSTPLCFSRHTKCREVQQKYKASLAMMQVRTTIEAKLMSPEFLVEIDIVAAVQ